MTVTAVNGCTYTLITENGFKIIKTDSEGKETVFDFQDLSISNFDAKKKEAVFYSYQDGEYKDRHSVKDFTKEYESFFATEVFQGIMQSLFFDFLKKIEFTEIKETHDN